ncbi:MAG: ABC transporter permease subunit [Ardenticatenia bacterium]|nr:ABC transporter permease subunit [Ardenticatenia bacterium]
MMVSQRIARPLGAVSPVLIKEMRARMRGARAFLILTAALLGFGGCSTVMYVISTQSPMVDPSSLSGVAVGQNLFRALMVFETFLLMLIVPGLAAGSISQEHEARTYEMLVATPLSPLGIVLGKMGATLSYVLLLMIAALPFTSLFFVLGGVTVSDIAVVSLVQIAIATMITAMCALFSALLRRTGRAVVTGYLMVAGLIVGPFLAFGIHGILINDVPPRFWLVINPLSAVSSALAPAEPGSVLTFIGQGVDVQAGVVRPTWHFTLLVYALVTLPAVVGSAYFVRPAARHRVRRRALATVGAGWALILVAALLAFSSQDWQNLVNPEVHIPPARQEIRVQEVPAPKPTAPQGK